MLSEIVSEIVRIFKPFFVYTLLMLVFVLGGRHTAKKHPDIWERFLPMFGYGVAAFNFYAAYLIIKAGGSSDNIAWADAFSHALLPILVGIIIMTLLRKQNEGK